MKFLILSCVFLLSLFSRLAARPHNDPATRCEPSRCKLPDCRCSGTDIPGNLNASNIPQIVMVTFDDAVNEQNFNFYLKLFNGKTNPNGCNISGTFFVSHEYTNYVMVNLLYHQGHSMADHSITHRTPISWWKNANYSQWTSEIVGQRTILNKVGFVAVEHVKGVRAPFLQIGGDNEFKMLYDNKFLFESSMPMIQRNPPLWPYTFDYRSTQECTIPPCPQDSYPGVWEIPMIDWRDKTGALCNMVDACAPPANAEEAMALFVNNFNNHYYANRAPFPMFFHSEWFNKYPYTLTALNEFFEKILKLHDVWIVSIPRAIDWIRQPTTNEKIAEFTPWMCNTPPPPLQCNASTQTVCGYDGNRRLVPRGQPAVHYLFSCLRECLKCYPWVNDPMGVLC